jgi:hypothetical protein
MTYYIYDMNGYVGDFASIQGLVELEKEIGSKLPTLFDDGVDDPQTVLKNLEGINSTNADIQSTIDLLRELAGKCKGTLIITDGVGIEEDEDESLQHGGPGSGWTAEDGHVPGSQGGSGEGISDEVKDTLSGGKNESIKEPLDKLVKGGNTDYGEKVWYDRNLSDYVNSGFVGVNRELRGIEKSQAMARIPELDQIINAAPPIPDGVVLWRGVGSFSGPRLANAEVGSECSDKAFQSHSISLTKAKDFSYAWFPDERKGEPGGGEEINGFLVEHHTIVRAISDGKVQGVFTDKMNEKEVIVKRGQRWKIVSKIEVDHEDSPGGAVIRTHIITVRPIHD